MRRVAGIILALSAALSSEFCVSAPPPVCEGGGARISFTEPENEPLELTTFNIRLADMTEGSTEREWNQRREGVYEWINTHRFLSGIVFAPLFGHRGVFLLGVAK